MFAWLEWDEGHGDRKVHFGDGMAGSFVVCGLQSPGGLPSSLSEKVKCLTRRGGHFQESLSSPDPRKVDLALNFAIDPSRFRRDRREIR